MNHDAVASRCHGKTPAFMRFAESSRRQEAFANEQIQAGKAEEIVVGIEQVMGTGRIALLIAATRNGHRKWRTPVDSGFPDPGQIAATGVGPVARGNGAHNLSIAAADSGSTSAEACGLSR